MVESVFTISNHVKIKIGDTDDLYNKLLGRPIAVSVDASKWSQYHSGIFNRCGTGVNHGALLVGVTN